jgi:hypothetical protein
VLAADASRPTHRTIAPSYATWDTQDPLTLRPDGYPASLPTGKIAHKLALRNVQLRAMPGRYVALFDGEGTLDFGFDAKVGLNACVLTQQQYTYGCAGVVLAECTESIGKTQQQAACCLMGREPWTLVLMPLGLVPATALVLNVRVLCLLSVLGAEAEHNGRLRADCAPVKLHTHQV